MRWKVAFLLSLGFFTAVEAQLPPDDPHWRLVFNESFDSLDLSIWKVANNFDHYGEPQVYTGRKENVFVRNGILVLKILKENYRCRDLNKTACNKPWYDYTSGWIETAPLLQLQYGYLESRIRLPHGHGLWPAFWTFVTENAPEPRDASEIDVFEMLGTRPSTVMGTNLHIGYCDCGINDCHCSYLNDRMCPEVDPRILCHGLDVYIPDYSEDFLTYGLEWTPFKIIWYVNGKMVRSSANPGIHLPVRVIFNLAITPWDLPDDSTLFPSEMEIDYLRIYQTEKDHLSIDSINYDFTGADGFVKDTIIIGGHGALNSVPEYGNVTLRAGVGIEIKGDFCVPLGAGLYLDVN